jgi:hypothetical protein
MPKKSRMDAALCFPMAARLTAGATVRANAGGASAATNVTNKKTAPLHIHAPLPFIIPGQLCVCVWKRAGVCTCEGFG